MKFILRSQIRQKRQTWHTQSKAKTTWPGPASVRRHAQRRVVFLATVSVFGVVNALQEELVLGFEFEAPSPSVRQEDGHLSRSTTFETTLDVDASLAKLSLTV